MDTKKKHRKVLRTCFSKKANELDKLFDETERNVSEIKVTWKVLHENYETLKITDGEVYNALLEDDASEEELLKEMEASEDYKKRYLHLYQKYCEISPEPDEGNSVYETGSGRSTGNADIQGKRRFKLPTIQLKVFDGNIKEWLPFWAQFKKVHDDPDICPEDKIQYLFQATLTGSRARQLVESFPAVGDNYESIIDCLTSRFGRDDLQIEVYIRELLKLILNNAISTKKLDTAVLYDKLETQLRALDTLGVKSDKCAAMLFPLIESCLPEDLIRVWQRSPRISDSKDLRASSGDLPPRSMEERLKSLMSFLQQEVENDQRIKLAAEGFGLKPVSSQKGSGHGATIPKHKVENFEYTGMPTAAGLINFNSKLIKCVFCEGSHESAECFKAQKFTLENKRSILAHKKACFNCLKIGHHIKKCRARIKCVICSKAHFPLMCPNLPDITQVKNYAKAEPVEATDSKEMVSVTSANSYVFMQILRVNLENGTKSRLVRVLIDTGSQRSYILRSTAKLLGLVSKRKEKIVHCLFGGVLSQQLHECYDIKISSSDFSLCMEVLGQNSICTHIPPVFHGDWMAELHSLGIRLSDQNNGPGDNDKIDILIGSDIAGILYTGRRHVLSSGLVAVETFLGWTLMGKVPSSEMSSTTMMDIALFAKDMTLPQLWEMDVLGIKDPFEKKSQEELAATTKAVFLETVVVNDEGRYEVCLPWLEGHPPLPSSYNMARSRLQSTLVKLEKDGLIKDYDEVFEEWLSEGIIEEVYEKVPTIDNVHYLPHRAVVKEGSTTRIRPVFDASARTKNEPSLNQCLDKGPNIIELIPNILIRFRLRRIGVISDIRKAFLQISVNESDRNFLRFLWIGDGGRERIFRHRRVVFGVSSSPFLLGATIEFHLKEALRRCANHGDGDVVPYTRETILQLLNSFYVDNCVASVSNLGELQRFMKESIILMNEAKFDLRGWEFSGQQYVPSETEFETPPLTAVLGMLWNKSDDTLSLNRACLMGVSDLVDGPITKRVMLSLAQRIFDPIGFTAPSTLLPKLLLQKAWTMKLSWDSPVDPSIEQEFRHWLKELLFIFEIKIPRWVHRDVFDLDQVSVHVFCDASKSSYASVVFMRGVFKGKVIVHLLAAKSRIAPLKVISIPRLELLGALIGTRLFVSLKNDLLFSSKIQVRFWTDSTTVLSWINRKENWATFVGNRVKEILSHTCCEDWHFVPGVMNPADLPSRGCSPKRLSESRWWEGPGWLYEEPHLWPQVAYDCDEMEVNKEKKKLVVTLFNVGSDNFDWHFDHFSKFNKTLRMVGWIFRFVHNVRNPESRLHGELSVKELEVAEIHVFKVIQTESFGNEKDARLTCLNPFKDAHGVIRLRSRISNRIDSDQFCFPVVLPAKHFLVNRLIFDQHVKALHVGTQALISILRENFWILGGRRVIRSAISNCAICRRQRSKSFETSLPPLPLNRVRDAVAFEIVGVDFAGPMFLRNREKAWVCLFTCAIYRAVHLELCTGLSTASFMQALRRFIARRGRPKTVYSDNGTNFVGTANAFEKLDWTKITAKCSVDKITWYFNPPTASWWGGFWERLVGVLKQILRKVLGRACVSYEDLLTILCDCEMVINSRPLTYVSNDADELMPLTPTMFLREQVRSGVFDCDVVESESLCEKIRHKQQLRDDLRQRFRSEYLGQLRSWGSKIPTRQISVGEMVLLGNDMDKRLYWPLGRVTEVIPGRDGQIRLARVKTYKGSLLRPVQRLFPLECDSRSTTKCEEYRTAANMEALEESEENLGSVKQSAGVPSRVPDQLTRVTRCGREIKKPKRFL